MDKACERAAKARRTLRDVKNPIAERERSVLRTDRFIMAAATEGCFNTRKAEMKNEGKSVWALAPVGNALSF